MRTRIEDWDESLLDVEDYQVERAANRAALDAICRARRFGTKYIIWEDGGVKALGPGETEPYERRLLENVEHLNQKIAALQAQTPNSLSLNERPKS